MELNAKLLGKFYAEIWWEHDKKSYSLIEKNYLKICELLHINKKKSKKIAIHVKKAYINSDLYENSPKFFDKCLKEFLIIRRTLELDDRISINQIKWWIAFRKKNYLLTTFFIFRQHTVMFNKIGVNTFLSTYYFIRSGFTHNQRNKTKTIYWLTKYWECFLFELPRLNNIPLPI